MDADERGFEMLGRKRREPRMDTNRHEFRMRDEVLTKVSLSEMELGHVCLEICEICEIRGFSFVVLASEEENNGF
jgi:hypothetical protein